MKRHNILTNRNGYIGTVWTQYVHLTEEMSRRSQLLFSSHLFLLITRVTEPEGCARRSLHWGKFTPKSSNKLWKTLVLWDADSRARIHKRNFQKMVKATTTKNPNMQYIVGNSIYVITLNHSKVRCLHSYHIMSTNKHPSDLQKFLTPNLYIPVIHPSREQ